LGVALPDPGQGLCYGLLEPNEDKVIEEMARKMLTSPMPDYRPKYPKIDPEEVINPNLTIWGNKIEACIFIGVHCHYANLNLKMIRAGTNCLTMAICAEQGHEDAMLTIRDSDIIQLRKTAQVFKRVRKEMGITLRENGENVRFTSTQSKVHGGKTHTNPLTFAPAAAGLAGAAAFGHSAEQMKCEG
jgi:hypothetical protein